MAVETVRYEGLRRSQSHSWDQASARSLEKNVGLIPSTYINQILAKFSMEGSKKGFVSFRVRISLSSNQRPKTQAEIERMRGIPYALAVESLMYAMLCIGPDICFVVGIVSRISLILVKNTGQR